MHDTVTAKAIAEALGVTERSIRRRSDREHWDFTEKAVRGGKQRLYPVASLPAPIQIALRNTRPALGIIQGGKTASAAVTASASTPPAPLATASPDVALPPAALSKAALKADLVKAYLEAKDWGRKHGKRLAQCREAFVLGYNGGQMCPAIHEDPTRGRDPGDAGRQAGPGRPQPARRVPGCAGRCGRSGRGPGKHGVLPVMRTHSVRSPMFRIGYAIQTAECLLSSGLTIPDRNSTRDLSASKGAPTAPTVGFLFF